MKEILQSVMMLAMVLSGCVGDETVSPPPNSDAAIDAVSANDAGDAAMSTDALSEAGEAGPTFRRVFITSQQWTANLGGTSGADAKCQAAANGASLGGTWMAWVSTSTSDTSSRFVHSTVPWKLLDGTLVANDWSDLTSGALENEITRDEHNSLVTWNGANYPTDPYSGIAWTDTSVTGKWSGYTDCSDFTDGTSDGYSSVGYNGYIHPLTSGSYWTDAQNTSGYLCNSVVSLYCFEQ